MKEGRRGGRGREGWRERGREEEGEGEREGGRKEKGRENKRGPRKQSELQYVSHPVCLAGSWHTGPPLPRALQTTSSSPLELCSQSPVQSGE